jgi:hypothetical protein
MGHEWRGVCIVAALICLSVAARAGEPAVSPGPAAFGVVNSYTAPGQQGALLPIEASFPVAAQGFSMAIAHDCEPCSVVGGSIESTISAGADFLSVLADGVAGTIVVGLLVDTEPPFDGAMLPPSEEPQVVLNLVLDMAAAGPMGTYTFSFLREGARSGQAWVFNAYAAFNQSYAVEELRPGVLVVDRKPQNGLPLFLRGDCNQDLLLDVADAVFCLLSLYSGGDRPRCIDACDTNDTGMVDLADPVYFLSYIFANGPRPPEPTGRPGLDWSPDVFDCDDPEAGWMTDFWPE